MFTVEKFLEGITNTTGLSIETKDERVLFTFSTTANIEDEEPEIIEFGGIDIEEIKALEREMDGYNWSVTSLHSKNSLEVAVKPHDRARAFLYRDDDQFSLSAHNYCFSLSQVSKKYMFALFCHFSSCAQAERAYINLRSFRKEKVEKLEDLCEGSRILTAKVVAPKEQAASDLRIILNSLLFNIAYNHHAVFMVSNFMENRRPLFRRSRREGQLFPYKSYKQELTRYYYQAVATDIPFVQYLAFYHVAEFFFQSISEQEAFIEISNYITRPSFSPSKERDIRDFYNIMKKRMREQRDDGVWNEKAGLLLCLKKYITDIDSLKNSIARLERSAIEYYRNSLVEFADDSKMIDFDATHDQIYICMRDRIYSVRNAIVHSKEGEKLRYEPFKHDHHLAKELPLIRSIAEEIIVNSAKPIEYDFGE